MQLKIKGPKLNKRKVKMKNLHTGRYIGWMLGLILQIRRVVKCHLLWHLAIHCLQISESKTKQLRGEI